MSRANTSSKTEPRRRRWWLTAIKISAAALVLMVAALVVVPILSPSAGASMADALRSVVGPEPVAALESFAFQVQDVINRARYQASGGQPQLTWANPASTPTASVATTKPAPSGASGKRPSGKPSPQTAQPFALPDVVTAPPTLSGGWQAFGPSGSGNPILARASVQPDPTRPYAQAALVRMDLSQIRLHVVPGTVEPVAARGVRAFPRPGVIPNDVQNSGGLLAAFNGGFKAIHGGYGMVAEGGVTILPPLDNVATVAMYRDGTVRIGAWGRDITTTADLIAYRQNCPLLVDAGQINSSVTDGSHKEWGYTVKNLDTTWRSGLGITQDGHFLIYAAGNSLTVETLARALQQAGAYYAMQLDINSFFTRFVTYRPNDKPKPASPVVADKLLNEMTAPATQFLHPYDRDFFYVTARRS